MTRARKRSLTSLKSARKLINHPVTMSTGLRAITLVVGVVSSVVLARCGGPEIKGVASTYAAANAVSFMVINFDLAQQALRQGRRHQDLGSIFPILRKTWAAYVVLGALAIGVLLIFDVPGGWIVLGAVTYLLGTQAGVATSGLNGPVVAALGAIIQQIGLILGTLAFWSTGFLDGDTVKIAVVVSYLLPMALYIPYLVRSGTRGGRPTWHDVTRLLTGGIIWQIGRLMQILIQRLDTLVVFSIMGASSAGVYSVGLSTAMLTTIVPAQFAKNALYEATRSKRLSTGKQSLYALISGLAPALVLLIVGRQAIVLLYSDRFLPAYPAMIACLAGSVSYGLVQVQTNYIRIIGKWQHLIFTSATGLIAMAILLALLLRPLGLTGAGIAFSCGSVVSAVVGAVVVHRLDE